VTTIEVAPEEALAVYELVNGIMLGDMQSPEVNEIDGIITFVNLYRSDVRQSDYYARFVAAALEPPLALAKASVRGKP
jgi:hypothetical protein